MYASTASDYVHQVRFSKYAYGIYAENLLQYLGNVKYTINAGEIKRVSTIYAHCTSLMALRSWHFSNSRSHFIKRLPGIQEEH